MEGNTTTGSSLSCLEQLSAVAAIAICFIIQRESWGLLLSSPPLLHFIVTHAVLVDLLHILCLCFLLICAFHLLSHACKADFLWRASNACAHWNLFIAQGNAAAIQSAALMCWVWSHWPELGIRKDFCYSIGQNKFWHVLDDSKMHF